MRKTIYSREYEILLELLVRARKRSGVTQTALAEALETTQSIVSKMERGERRLDVIEVWTICEAIAVSFSGLMRQFEQAVRREFG